MYRNKVIRRSEKTIKKVVKDLKKSGIIIPGRPKNEIVNIVSSGDLGGVVDLERSATLLTKLCMNPNSSQG